MYSLRKIQVLYMFTFGTVVTLLFTLTKLQNERGELKGLQTTYPKMQKYLSVEKIISIYILYISIKY